MIINDDAELAKAGGFAVYAQLQYIAKLENELMRVHATHKDHPAYQDYIRSMGMDAWLNAFVRRGGIWDHNNKERKP